MSEDPDRWNDEWNDLPKDMHRFATRIGPTDEHILLLGPPGSGKGYLARILHELSPRAGGPLVTRNTGATDSKPGLVAAAAGGTLFLDEFGALSHAIQAMFLIFLETGKFSRLGSSTVHKTDIRIIAATNRDLGAAIAAGNFREDLVARFSFYHEVPPLRERRREIAGIVDHHFRANGARCREATELV